MDARLLTRAQCRAVLDENQRLRDINDALVKRNQILTDREKACPWLFLPHYTMDTVHLVRDDL